MKKMYFTIFCFVILALSAVAQVQPPTGATPRSDGGWQVDANTIWYPPTMTRTPIGADPRPVTIVSANNAGDPTGVAQLRQEIVAVRPPSSGDARVDADNNRTDLEWGHLAQQRERDAQRVELERTRLAVQRERELIRLTIERERQNQRAVESWSRVISDQLNSASRRRTERERADLAQRQQRQREVESTSRIIERAAEQWRRSAHQR